MSGKEWLKAAIKEYVKNNPNKDSVDIAIHFKLRADITVYALGELVEQGELTRKCLSNLTYGYVCN